MKVLTHGITARKYAKKQISSECLRMATFFKSIPYFRVYKDRLKLYQEHCVDLKKNLSASKRRFTYEHDKLMNENLMLKKRREMDQFQEGAPLSQTLMSGMSD